VELDDAVGQGEYVNFAVVTHSPAEFVMDFIRVLPGMKSITNSADEYEDKSARIKYVDAKHDLKEVTTNEEEFREWDGIEEDWQEFNRKHIKDENKPS
jgi:hypothetical protein